MTSRPTSPVPRDDLRIGDAERDAVTVALHGHFAEGRLDRAELDERLGTALAARTRGDLHAIVRDLPGPSGLPEPERAVAASGQVPRGMARRHRHGPPFPAFPLLLGVFLVLAFTAGPGTGVLVVLQIALVVWIVRALLTAFGLRRSRRHTRHPSPGA